MASSLRNEGLTQLHLGVDLRTNTKKGMCLNEIGLHAQTLLLVLSSIFNINGRTYMITF